MSRSPASLTAPRHWPLWLALGLYRLFLRLPWRLRHATARGVATLYRRSNNRRVRIARTNLALAFPEQSAAWREALLRDNLATMACAVADYGLLWWRSEAALERLLMVEGETHLRRCVEAGQPVILLTGHSVALDFGALAISRRFAAVGLVKRMKNPLADRLVWRGRTRFRGHLHTRDEGLRPIIRAIKHGAAFYYLPDEDLSHVRGSEWRFLPFFGLPTATITALPRLARVTGATILPCMTRLDPATGTYRVTIDPPLTDYPTDDEQAGSERMNQELERMVRRDPRQYMWTLRLFKTRPNGEPSPYD